MAAAIATTLFTGRDILAAENHLRQGTEAAARALIEQMPAEIVERLATHVSADASNLSAVVYWARQPYSARSAR